MKTHSEPLQEVGLKTQLPLHACAALFQQLPLSPPGAPKAPPPVIVKRTSTPCTPESESEAVPEMVRRELRVPPSWPNVGNVTLEAGTVVSQVKLDDTTLKARLLPALSIARLKMV